MKVECKTCLFYKAVTSLAGRCSRTFIAINKHPITKADGWCPHYKMT